MPNAFAGYLIDLFALAGVLFAFWKGGRAERTAAAIVLVNVIIGQISFRTPPHTEALIRLVNDGLTALALLGVTLRYGALWMGGVMLFFAAQFSMHSFYLVMNRPNDRLHAIINNIDFSAIIWCLIIGTVVAWRQRARSVARQAQQTAP